MRPRREGHYVLYVLLNGEHVLGSPQPLSVLASKPHPPQCSLAPLRAPSLVCGDVAICHLLLRDAYGNELIFPPDAQDRNLKLELTCDLAVADDDPLVASASRLERQMDMLEGSANLREAERRAAARKPPTATYVLRDDGVVVISVRSEVAGRFTLSAVLDGVTVTGSPAALPAFAPRPAFAPCCWAHAVAVRTVAAGHSAGLVVRCFDEFGNDACDDSNDLVGRLARDGPATALQARLPQVRARAPEPPGTSVVVFTPSKAAEYTLDVSMNGMALPGSPFPITVTPSHAAAIASTLHGEGLVGAVVRRGGLERALELTCHDVYGNRCVAGGAEVTVSLDMVDAEPLSRPSSARPPSARTGGRGGSSGGGGDVGHRPTIPVAGGRLEGAVIDRGDGSYEMTYLALPGEWLLVVHLNGRAVAPTPCSIVNAADPSEEEERKAREAAERARQQQDADEAEAARLAAEEAEAERLADETRWKIEKELIAAAQREDEKLRRAAEAAVKRASQEDEKRRRVVAALKREEETRRRAQAALEEMQAEKARQVAEALRRKQMFSKRTGGGFVVNFKPPQVDNFFDETTEEGGARAAKPRAGAAAAAAGGSRRLDLFEQVDDA